MPSISVTTFTNLKIQDNISMKVQNHYISHWILCTVNKEPLYLVAQRPVFSVEEDDNLAQSFGGSSAVDLTCFM
jgi:hypothetical protein